MHYAYCSPTGPLTAIATNHLAHLEIFLGFSEDDLQGRLLYDNGTDYTVPPMLYYDRRGTGAPNQTIRRLFGLDVRGAAVVFGGVRHGRSVAL